MRCPISATTPAGLSSAAWLFYSAGSGDGPPLYGGTPMTCLQSGIQPLLGLSLQKTV